MQGDWKISQRSRRSDQEKIARRNKWNMKCTRKIRIRKENVASIEGETEDKKKYVKQG